MSVKIALIGAGSQQFGPLCVRDILLSEDLEKHGVEIALMDIVADHLADIERYASHLSNSLGRSAKVSAGTDLDTALDGASFVVTSFEVDRYLYWSQDFHVPRKHGFRQAYGENGGPGGIFHALRNMGPIIEIARAMERLCPQALMLNFTNPESKLCEAVSRLTAIRSVGLCHGVFQGLKQVASVLGCSHLDLDTAACGINHFTWFQRICDRNTGENLYPKLRDIEREADWLCDWHELAFARILFRLFGLWPSPAPNHYGEYLRWAEEFVVSELQYFYDPRDGHPWETGKVPEFVYDPSRRSDQPVAPGADGQPRNVGERQAEEVRRSWRFRSWRASCAVSATHCRRSTCPTKEPSRTCQRTWSSRIPGVVDQEGLRPVLMDALPEAIAAHVRVQGSIHALIVEAFAECSKGKLLQALLLDPTVDSYRRAVECLNEMLTLQKDFLPRFN